MDLSGAQWRKSSRSGSSGGQCVEVAANLPGMIAVRDSKNPEGPVLIYTPDEWRAFIAGVKAHEFDI
jgi:predicted secreted Zn-dependent protease